MISSYRVAGRLSDHPEETILILGDELLLQDCMAAAIGGAFPSSELVRMATVSALEPAAARTVTLVILLARHLQQSLHAAADLDAISHLLPGVPIVIVSNLADDTSIDDAMIKGAKGVIPTSVSLRIGLAALQLVMAGGTYFPRKTHDDMRMPAGVTEVSPAHAESEPIPGAAGNRRRPGWTSLDGSSVTFTTREAQVLAALQRGRSNKWIANHLNLSENTIKVYIRHIMRKLHASNRTEAAIMSQRLVLDQNADATPLNAG
jgi:DNA-binding NarL/FixJ family response regulator